MIRESGNRLSRATNAEGVCAEITLQQQNWSAMALHAVVV
jgi:hypothetical protein